MIPEAETAQEDRYLFRNTEWTGTGIGHAIYLGQQLPPLSEAQSPPPSYSEDEVMQAIAAYKRKVGNGRVWKISQH